MKANQNKNGLTKEQLAIVCGLRYSSGTFSTYMSELRSKGLIEQSGKIKITSEGRGLTDGETMTYELEKIVEMWMGKVSQKVAQILETVYNFYVSGNESVTKEQIGEIVGLSHTSGTFSTYLSELRSAGIISTRGDEVSLHSRVLELV